MRAESECGGEAAYRRADSGAERSLPAFFESKQLLGQELD